MQLVTILLMTAAVAPLAQGCRTELIRNVRVPLVAPAGDMSDMAQLLTLGAERCGWRVRNVGPGRLRGEKIVTDHRAVSEIAYDSTGYSITLLQADNLRFDGTQVHKAYNVWVEKLQKCIDDELRFRSG